MHTLSMHARSPTSLALRIHHLASSLSQHSPSVLAVLMAATTRPILPSLLLGTARHSLTLVELSCLRAYLVYISPHLPAPPHLSFTLSAQCSATTLPHHRPCRCAPGPVSTPNCTASPAPFLHDALFNFFCTPQGDHSLTSMSATKPDTVLEWSSRSSTPACRPELRMRCAGNIA